MKRIKIFIFLSIISLLPLLVKANNRYKRSFFSGRHHPRLIMTMAYDNDGFLWIGSLQNKRKNTQKYGLMRFDGNRFHTIHLPGYGNNNSSVADIVKTDAGLFYLLCWGKGYQLLMLNPHTLDFKRVDFSGYHKKNYRLSRVFTDHGRYYTIVQDSSGRATLFRLDSSKAQRVTNINLPPRSQISQFSVFIPYKNYFLLKANNQGSRLYNWEGKMIRKVSDSNPYRRFSLYSLDGKKVFMQSMGAVLYTFDTTKKEIIPRIDCKALVGHDDFWFWNDEEGHLLLSVERDGGVDLYHVRSEGVQKIDTIKDLNISFWPKFYAQNGLKSVWIANQAKHLVYYALPPHPVENYLTDHAIGPLVSLSQEKILAAANSSGLYTIDARKGEVDHFDLMYKGKPFRLTSCRNIIAGKDKRYLWSNSGRSIVRINRKTHQVKYWETAPVESLADYDDSLLVFGTFKSGLFTFNKKTKKTTLLFQDKQHWIKQIHVDGNTLFAATSGGLLCYHVVSDKGRFYVPDDGQLQDRTFNCIYGWSSDSILLGTDTGKMYLFDTKTSSFQLLYEIPDHAAIISLEKFEENIWMNTTHGFYAMNLPQKKVNVFSTVEGFSYNYATRFSTLKEGNRLFIGTLQGLNSFYPTTLKPSSYRGEMTPLSLKLYNRKKDSVESVWSRDKLASGLEFVLPVRNRLFRLTFGLKGKSPLRKVYFRYRLNRQKWFRIHGGNFIQFDHLAPGRYYLEVAAFNAYGKQISQPLYYHLKVKDFFYKRWWFAASVVLVVLLTVGGIIFSRKQQRELALRKEAWENLSMSKQNLEEKYEIGRQLFIEKERALLQRQRELVVNSLQMVDLKAAVYRVIEDWEKGKNATIIKRRLKAVLNRSEEWEFFTKKFTAVYPGFVEDIKKKHPALTKNDVEFCMLIKLGLANKEIASLLHISHQSVITKRYRVRKKLALNERDLSLDQWIVRF